MIKELLLAIALGAILGFGITGGFFTFKKNKTPTPNTNSTVNTENSSTPETISVTPTGSAVSQKTDHQLTIDSPENETVVNTSKITIKGFTDQNSLIVIRTPSKTFTATADSSGNFTANIDLETGVNLIKISAIDANSDQKDTNLTITYSTASI